MKLSEYPRPKDDTGLGIHGGANAFHPLGERPSDYPYWIAEMQAMGFKWCKLTVAADTGGEAIKALLAGGIMPIVRMYRFEPNPGTLDEDPKGKEWMKRYVDMGVRYFEVNNEPNLLNEWKGGWKGDGSTPWEKSNPNQPQVVAENWVKDAEYVLSIGGLPGTPALAPGGHYNDVDFFKAFLSWLKVHGYADLLQSGCWISIHNCTFNHPLDYPFDDVNQNGTPVTPQEYARYEWAGDINFVNRERSRGKNPGQHLLSVDADGKDVGASNGWLKFQAYHDIFVQLFGFEIPILGTEGGVWPGTLVDPRYPRISLEMHRDWTVEICRRMMANEYPDYYFCTGFWLIANRNMGAPTSNGFENDAWYSYWRNDIGGRLPVVDALKALPKRVRRPPQDIPVAPGVKANSRIYGTITDTRAKPVSNLAVTLRSSIFAATDTTDTEGKYQFRWLPAGTYAISAGGVTKTVETDGSKEYETNLVVPAQVTYKYVVTKKRLLSREEGAGGCGFFGTVTDKDGNPLNNIRLRVSWPGGSANVVTGEKGPGRYEFLASPGEFQITVAQGDWPSEVANGLKTDWVPEHDYGKAVYEVNFQLQPETAPEPTQPPTPPTPPTTPPMSTVTYTVQRGDTLSSIARRFNTTVDAIVKANNIADPSKIRVGQVLVIPVPAPPGAKIGHYLLLGKPDAPETRVHLLMALDAILKRGLTVGFSLDEAVNASRITIVGGPEVVTPVEEQTLKDTGHQVERIAGDAYAIQQGLADLAAGRRGVRRTAEGQPAYVPTGKAAVILGSKPR